MLHIYEFEVYKGENNFIVEPFDFNGATQGVDIKDAYESTFDWLKTTLEDYIIRNIEPPKATYQNKPLHNGYIIVVGVNVGIETINRVSAAEAARMLEVSPARISQLASNHQLETLKRGGTVWVTVDSINQRLAEMPSAGRPKHALAM